VDPEGDEWDNLDAEDADDRLMVSEYVVEILQVHEGGRGIFSISS